MDSMSRVVSLAGALVALTIPGVALANGGGGSCGPVGATSLLAEMPVTNPFFPPTGPTYPEGVAVVGDRVIVSGPANFGTAGNGSPSQLTVFNRHTGALVDEVPVAGEALEFEHALSELDAWHNYVYAPSTQLGVLRWKVAGNQLTQESYSTPFCSVTGFFPCHLDSDKCPADVRPGLPPLPNGIVVDHGGDVYVTDSLQGIIWRIPAEKHGAEAPFEPEVVLCSRALQGLGPDGLLLFGANGITSIGDFLYVAVTFGPPDGIGVPSSIIYRLPKDNPQESDLEEVYVFSSVEVAPGIFVPPILDGLRYAPRTGHLLAVLGGQNQIVELDIDGPAFEVARYSRNDPDHPFFNPSTIALSPDGHTGYVANHAITCCLPGDPSPACTCTAAQDLFGVIEVCLP